MYYYNPYKCKSMNTKLLECPNHWVGKKKLGPNSLKIKIFEGQKNYEEDPMEHNYIAALFMENFDRKRELDGNNLKV